MYFNILPSGRWQGCDCVRVIDLYDLKAKHTELIHPANTQDIYIGYDIVNEIDIIIDKMVISIVEQFREKRVIIVYGVLHVVINIAFFSPQQIGILVYGGAKEGDTSILRGNVFRGKQSLVGFIAKKQGELRFCVGAQEKSQGKSVKSSTASQEKFAFHLLGETVESIGAVKNDGDMYHVDMYHCQVVVGRAYNCGACEPCQKKRGQVAGAMSVIAN